jgi:Lon protease-like protein
MDLPLFPLHTVLCPGVALPLHVFEDRYKAMVERCLAHRSPFGVVLIREGREVGPGELAVAAVGTVAEIREATRYADGRFDLLTLGTQRFRLEGVDPAAEPYLVGQITPMGEVLGEAARAKSLSDRVVQLFIRYLELLQVDGVSKRTEAGRVGREDGVVLPPEAPGEPWAIDPDDLADAYADALEAAEQEAAAAEQEAAATDGGAAAADQEAAATGGGAASTEEAAEPFAQPVHAEGDAESPKAEHTFDAALDEAARRLTIPEDPTVLSYLLSGIVQIESIRRQGLLEMPTTELRLVELALLLDREIVLLERGLGTYSPDPRLAAHRRN